MLSRSTNGDASPDGIVTAGVPDRDNRFRTRPAGDFPPRTIRGSSSSADKVHT
mgnify:CR=1 FL=1